MTANEIITVLEQVSSFDAGEPYKIECYGNQFLLQKEDIDVLLDYIKQLESAFDEIRVIVSKSLFKTDLVELCRMKNQIKEVLDKVGDSNGYSTKLIDNNLWIQIKTIEKLDNEFYKVTFMDGQTFLIRGDKNE